MKRLIRTAVLSASVVLASATLDAADELASFGDISTAAAAEKTLAKAIEALMAKGGGVLVIPADAPQAMKVANNSQTDRNGHAVTILDYRKGFVDAHLPAMGKHKTGVWAGQRLQRTVNLIPAGSRFPFQGVHAAQAIQNYVISGSSSYMATLTRSVKKGKDQRVYVDLIRGIYPGQYLTVTSSVVSYSPPYDRIIVKSIGWDDEAKRNYFMADFEHDHGVGCLVYNKHVVNGVQIEGNSNADNQTMELQVTRRVYGVGDSFGVSSAMYYMSDIFSGFGDEGACIINSESVGMVDGFHSTVEAVNWDNDEITYAAGQTNPHTLSPSRPLINMNQDKWITRGKVFIVNPSGKWHGKTYPNKVGGPGNVFAYAGGAIFGSKDCGWTQDIVGRFFAVTDPTEVLSPDDGSTAGGYATLPDRPVYRWYRIMALETGDDGMQRLRILRVRWSAVAAGAPKLFRDDNYTRDGREKPLSYAIAPGAWVYDVSRGWADTIPTGGHIGADHPRKIRVVSHADRGTQFDFAAGDKIEQAVGPDPWHPVPIRIRQFDQMPTTMNGGTIQIEQHGRVQVPHALLITGITRSLDDLPRRKDRKPAFNDLISLQSVSHTGIRFNSPVLETAILFDQPGGNVQPIRWRRTTGGTSALYVEPSGDGAGDLVFEGGHLNLKNHGVKRAGGLSGTDRPAKNLRGINVRVPAGETTLDVKFPAAETDADYSLIVQPNWLTMDRVARKRADGFSVEFSQPAPTKATIDWQLIR